MEAFVYHCTRCKSVDMLPPSGGNLTCVCGNRDHINVTSFGAPKEWTRKPMKEIEGAV
jgi:hypothetical protein